MSKKGTRKFNGKRFKYAGHESTKKEAEIHAERIRSRGTLVRVVKCDEGRCLFSRATKKGAKKNRRIKKHTKKLTSAKRKAKLYPYD